jgi:hypothetical protein
MSYDGTPLSVVLAPSRNMADIFWQGQGIFPHDVHEIDPDIALEEHPTGVLPIVTVLIDNSFMGKGGVVGVKCGA